MHTNLKTVSGCATRLTVTVTAPEGADKTLTAYCRCCGDSHPATVEGDTVTFPPLPAGEHLFELRAGGVPVVHGHLIARLSAFPVPPMHTVDHTVTADLDGTTVANLSVTLNQGARGPQGPAGEMPDMSGYATANALAAHSEDSTAHVTAGEHAVLANAAQGELWVPGSTGSVTLAGQQGDGVAVSAANNTSRVQVQNSGVTITAPNAPQWLEAGDTPAFYNIRTAKDLTATDASIAAAMAAKQDALTAGDGISIDGNVISAQAQDAQITAGDGIAVSNGTVAMSGSLDRSLAIGGSRVEEAVISDGPCAVYKYTSFPFRAPQWMLSENEWSGPYGPGSSHVERGYISQHGNYTITSIDDLREYADLIKADTDSTLQEWIQDVKVYTDLNGEACICLIPTAAHAGAQILSDTTWYPLWQQMEDRSEGMDRFTYQRVTGMVATLTDYTLSLNGSALLPPTDKVENGNTAPVSSSALYNALAGKQDKLTLQTTLSMSTSAVPTGAAVYKALGNRAKLEFDTAPTSASNKLLTSGAIYTALAALEARIAALEGSAT